MEVRAAMVKMCSLKYLILGGLTLLMGCSFQADDYELSGLKANSDIALPLAFGDITIEDIIERASSAPNIIIVGNIAGGNDDNIELIETVELDLGDIENSEVLSGSLKISTENEMPLEATVQIDLVDENDAVIETLVPATQTNWVKAGTVDGAGNSVTKGVFNETIELDKAKMDKLFEAKSMIVTAILSTNNGGSQTVSFNKSLKIVNHYGLRIKLKTQVDL
jgi:hypothetical protein